MTSVSSANSTDSTELGYGVSGLQSVAPTGATEHPLTLLHRPRPRPSASTDLTVSLVVPALNEARNIAWVFEQIPTCVDEVILVDGDSTDATVPMAQHCLPNVHNVRQSGRGKGNALRTGFLAAKGDYVVMMDADGSMSPEEIRHSVHFLDHGYDFVKGSRFIAGGGSLDITPSARWATGAPARRQPAVPRLPDRSVLRLLRLSAQLPRPTRAAAAGFEIEAEMIVHAMQLRSAHRRGPQPGAAPPQRRLEPSRHPRRHPRPANRAAPSPLGCVRTPLPGGATRRQTTTGCVNGDDSMTSTTRPAAPALTGARAPGSCCGVNSDSASNRLPPSTIHRRTGDS